MNTNENAPQFDNVSLRAAATIASVGLLLMAILSPIALLNTFPSLVKFDDAALTAQNILNSMGAFRTAVLLLFAVALLDVVVAWGLYIVLMPVNKNLAALAAWLRVIYAGIFIFAISKLFVAMQVLTADGVRAMSFLKAFQSNYTVHGATKVGKKGVPMKARRKAERAICPFLRAVER